MRLTGLIFAALGLIGGVICVIALMLPATPDTPQGAQADGRAARPNLTVPIVVCGVAVVIGAGMWLYGGRGYIVNSDPRVRN